MDTVCSKLKSLPTEIKNLRTEIERLNQQVLNCSSKPRVSHAEGPPRGKIGSLNMSKT